MFTTYSKPFFSPLPKLAKTCYGIHQKNRKLGVVHTLWGFHPYLTGPLIDLFFNSTAVSFEMYTSLIYPKYANNSRSSIFKTGWPHFASTSSTSTRNIYTVLSLRPSTNIGTKLAAVVLSALASEDCIISSIVVLVPSCTKMASTFGP